MLRFLQSTPSLRYAAHYAAFFVVFGAVLPYLPVWLQGRGLSPEAIGIAAAAGMVGRVIVSPLAARLMDGSGRRRDVLIAICWASLAIFIALVPSTGTAMLIAVPALAMAVNGGQTPLLDALAIRAALRDGFAFGKVRAAGSAAFVVANVGAGFLIGKFGGEAALVWMICGSMIAVATAYLLPKDPPPQKDVSNTTQKWTLRTMLTPVVILALVSSALVQGAHGFNYGFSTLAWRDQGVPPEIIGLLWAWAVLAEIVFLWRSAKWLVHWRPEHLILIGAAASIVRWGLFSLSPPLWALFVLQTLHALTYTATYLGFIRFAAEHVPERYSASAQALSSALSGGIVLASTTAISGLLFERYGAGGFAGMIVPAAMGGAMALWLSGLMRSQRLAKSPKE
tara:strand:+ start:3422 stop:4609 length:1188 start_codon:yes stop_codon:yes gene_type:complete